MLKGKIMIEIQKNRIPEIEDLVYLYEAAGWRHYTKDPAKLRCAFESSRLVLSAWQGEVLVGILRAVGDGCTILYIQDILVQKEYQRQGIGSRLLKEALLAFPDIRQTVLMTDDRPELTDFYKACGFVPVEVYDGVAFVKYALP